MKRAFRRGVRNPSTVAPVQALATGAPAQNPAPAEAALPPSDGFVISFPDGRLLRTNEVEAFIQGPVDVFVGCGRPLLSCFSRVIFMTGGIVNLHHGGTIYFLDRSMIEVPYSCEIAVPVGAIIEFALNLPAEE